MKFRFEKIEDGEEEIIARVKKKSSFTDELEQMVASYDLPGEIPGYFGNEIVMMKVCEIECFFTEEGKTYAHYSDNRTYIVKKRLYELSEILPKEFEMISKSAIANWRKIVKLKAQLSGAVNAVFKSGYVEYISRRCFADLKRRYNL